MTEKMEPILETMPFLEDFLKFSPKTAFLSNEKKGLMLAFNSMVLTEATIINDFQRSEENILSNIDGTGLGDFIQIEPNMRLSKQMKLLKEKQIEILLGAYIELAEEYEKLAESKKETKTFTVFETITEEKTTETREKFKDLVEQFYKTVKKAKAPRLKVKKAKKKFVIDNAENDFERAVLEKVMDDYENKTEDNNEHTDKDTDSLQEM